MADFVAVIRRAVDGLANNTPEMRIRVYEKARGAVQRQLENMKPRPSDEMLRRQMEKLDAAIREVEAEHQEALPPEDAMPVASAAASAFVQPEPVHAEEEPRQEPAYQEPVSTPAAAEEQFAAPVEPQSYASQSYETPSYREPVYEEPAYEEPAASYENEATYQAEPQETDPADATYEEPEPVASPVTAEEAYEAPAERYAPEEPEPLPVQPYDAADSQQVADTAWPEPEPQGAEPVRTAGFVQGAHPEADPFADDEDHIPQRSAERDYADETPQQKAADDWQEVDAAQPVTEPDLYGQPESFRPATQAAPAWPDAPSTAPLVGEPDAGPQQQDWYAPEVAASAVSAPDVHSRREEPQTDEAFWAPEADYREQPDQRQAPPQAASQRFDDSAAAELFSAHFSEEHHASAQARMPSVSDLPDFNSSPAAKPSQDPEDLLADFIQPRAQAPRSESIAKTEEHGPDNDPWNDLEEFIGQDRHGIATAGAAAAGAAAASSPAARVALNEDNPRSEADDNRELEELMAAPAARSYRVQPKRKRSIAPLILSVVGLLLLGGGGYAIWMNRDALTGVIGSVASDGSTTQQAPGTANTAVNEAQQAGQTQPPQQAATPGQPAATGEEAGPQKFTQRLLADGTEVDDGTGGPAATAQNQSVAQVSAAGEVSQAATPGQAGATSTGTPPVGSPEQPTNTVATAGDKIFLYEERIGQSSPTAVEGSVSWSLQKESGENGKTEPTVQGRISVPGRGLTALVTFKRNTDPSLPASHLVEFVFSLPPNFEGGSIDNVQRIAMKSSEQDRGDALVAVPAKITTDFHMIALNDFPDARARNLDLMKTRDWMDVPLIYGTGRRALLTLQKGEDGRKAFDEAIREWQAIAPPQQGQ